MSITYYARTEQELLRANIREGEIVLYTGSNRDGLRSGPTSSGEAGKTHAHAYVYHWLGDREEDVDADFERDSVGAWVLEAAVGEDRYVFVRNEEGTFVRQVSGPDKPVVVGNIGAQAIRVDTRMGKFVVPAGTVCRLDRHTPLHRARKKVLVTFSDEDGERVPVESALLLEAGRWRPLNLCADGRRVQIKDGLFVVQTLVWDSCQCCMTLEDPPEDPDYEIYFRTAEKWFKVRFAGVGMKDTGLTRKHYNFCPKQGVIYEFERLRQTPAAVLMEQCTAQLPGLEESDAPENPGDLAEPDPLWPLPPEDKPSGAALFPPLGWPVLPGSGEEWG